MTAESAERPGGPGRILKILRWVAFAACFALFVRALTGADLTAAWGRIRALGPLAIVVVVPFPFALALDAWAWKGLLAAIDRSAPWLVLFKVRIATEAITNSAPAGALWADAISPILVSRRTGIGSEDVFAASTAKRWTVVRMHGAYVALAAAFGSAGLLHASRALIGSDALLLIVLGAALALVLLSIGIEALAARGQIAGRLSARLGKARFVRLKIWIEARRHHFARADVQLARLSKDTGAGVTAAWRMLGLWIIEGFETYLILRLLGCHLSLIEVMSFDAALSVVRSSAMFAPAGIGVQDVGYLAMLEAYGVADAASLGPAFIVLKRMKEAFWVAIGFILLARTGPGHVIAEAKAEADAEARADAEAAAATVAAELAAESAQSAAHEPPAST